MLKNGKKRRVRFGLCGCFFLWCMSGCFATMHIPTTQAYTSQKGWFVSAQQAHTLLKKGAILWDARKEKAFRQMHIQGAQHTSWQHFSEAKGPYHGRLLKDTSILNRKLQVLGVDAKRPILVYGDPSQGWGEEGRLVWMLRTFGHTQASVIDGGYRALSQVKGLGQTSTIQSARRGSFTIQRTTRWEIFHTHLKKQTVQQQFPQKATLIDTRELREYQGKTPYGESRGGHIPGAQHVYYKDLLTAQGFLHPRNRLLKLLKRKGITPEKPVVAYCTGGIRSGWLVAVLFDLGFKDVKNYAGSMWEWSSFPAKNYPLTSSH